MSRLELVCVGGGLFILLSLLMLMPAVAACERIEVSSPARFSSSAERQPVIAWQGDAAERYRVQVAVVLPESRLLASHDVEVTGNSWQWAAAFAGERAAVKVLVSKGCGASDPAQLNAQGAWFFIDARAACHLDAASLGWTHQGLRWEAVARASAYRVRVFSGSADGGEGLVQQQEAMVENPRWDGAGFTAGPGHAVSIQPVCGSVAGRAVAVASVPRVR